MLATAETIL